MVGTHFLRSLIFTTVSRRRNCWRLSSAYHVTKSRLFYWVFSSSTRSAFRPIRLTKIVFTYNLISFQTARESQPTTKCIDCSAQAEISLQRAFKKSRVNLWRVNRRIPTRGSGQLAFWGNSNRLNNHHVFDGCWVQPKTAQSSPGAISIYFENVCLRPISTHKSIAKIFLHHRIQHHITASYSDVIIRTRFARIISKYSILFSYA